jgi:hypothetical protein
MTFLGTHKELNVAGTERTLETAGGQASYEGSLCYAKSLLFVLISVTRPHKWISTQVCIAVTDGGSFRILDSAFQIDLTSHSNSK